MLRRRVAGHDEHAPGVYYAACDIQVSGADLGGRVTLVSEGRVKLSGSVLV